MFPKAQGFKLPQKATMFSKEKELFLFEDMIGLGKKRFKLLLGQFKLLPRDMIIPWGKICYEFF
jgi:hypothetical protein